MYYVNNMADTNTLPFFQLLFDEICLFASHFISEESDLSRIVLLDVSSIYHDNLQTKFPGPNRWPMSYLNLNCLFQTVLHAMLGYHLYFMLQILSDNRCHANKA